MKTLNISVMNKSNSPLTLNYVQILKKSRKLTLYQK